MSSDFESTGLRDLISDCPDDFLRVQLLHKMRETMSDPSDWFRAKRVWGTPGGPGKFHVTDLSSAIQWSVTYVMRARMSCDDPVSYYFDKPVCLNTNVQAGDSEWDIHEVCRQMLEKEMNPPEPTIIDTITVESENGPVELKVATNLNPVEGTTNMYTIPDSTEPAVERNPYKAFAFMASEDVAEFIREYENTKLIGAIIGDSREFKLWLEKGKPSEPAIEHYTLTEAAEEWDPCLEQDDQVWELQNELSYTRRELRRTERDCNGWRRMAWMNFITFAIYVAVDIASRFLNN